jgi:glutamate-1-semialdehyde aminotransferase
MESYKKKSDMAILARKEQMSKLDKNSEEYKKLKSTNNSLEMRLAKRIELESLHSEIATYKRTLSMKITKKPIRKGHLY